MSSKGMSPNDLEMMRIRCQVIALETVVSSFIGAIYRLSSPDGKATLLRKLDELPQMLDTVRLPGAAPELSDLMASELRDAGESLVAFLKAHLDKQA